MIARPLDTWLDRLYHRVAPRSHARWWTARYAERRQHAEHAYSLARAIARRTGKRVGMLALPDRHTEPCRHDPAHLTSCACERWKR